MTDYMMRDVSDDELRTYRLVPFKNNQPCPMSVPGCEQLFVPVFTTAEKLHLCMSQIGITEYVIKQVTDHQEFLAECLEADCRVMGNPYLLPNGRSRWLELTNQAMTLEQLRTLRKK